MEILRPRHKSQEHSWLLCYKSVYGFIILTLLDTTTDGLWLHRVLAPMAWKDVDGAPEARPACEAAQAHVNGDQAGGGADDHGASVIYVICPTMAVTDRTPLDGKGIGATLSPL